MAKGTADDFIWEMLKSKERTLIKAGIFNETLSDSKASSSAVRVLFLNVFGEQITRRAIFLQTAANDRTNSDVLLSSQSSLDDAIASMSTDEMTDQSSKPESKRNDNAIPIQDKENKLGKNDLHGLLDDGDEDFVGLDF